jgi:hypothetical protein
MQRFAAIGLFLVLLLTFGLSGCGGSKTTSSGTVTTKPTTVTLSPSSISLERGGVLQVTVQALDAKGNTILSEASTFASSNTAEVTVSTSGLVCAGTWDSLTAPVVCTPAAATGTSNLTATAGGTTSNTVLVSVHEHVNNIVVCRQGDPDPCPLLAPPVVVDCRSGTQVTGVTPVNQTEQLKASAYSGGIDITSTVGAFSWLVTDGTIATATSLGPSTSPLLAANQAIFTAKGPGQTNIAATISGTNSVPAAFITCSPHTITIHGPAGPAETSFSIATPATKQLTADVVDTAGTTITGLTLTWETSQPAIASVTSAGLVQGAAPGTSVITASCAPTTCNVGLNQTLFSSNVYSNPVTATITGTATTTTVYATTTTAPASGGHTDLIPISTSTNTVGTAIALPTDAAINSLIINSAGSKAYLGSSQGLVVVDVSTNTLTSTVTNALGTALGVSPTGQFVVTSDTGAGKVYVYDAVNSTVTSFNIAGATHVSFTQDSLKAYIVAGANLYQYSPLFALRTIPLNAPANDVAVNSNGQFAYTAGGNASSVVDRATCVNDSTWAPAAGDIVGTGATPDLIASAATGDLLAVEGAASEINKITPAIGAPAAGTSCPPTLTSNTLTTANFGVGAFTPRQIIVTSDGSKAYVTSNQASLLVFNVGAATTDVIPLAGGGTQSFTGGATLDGKNLYVGVGGVNAVHRIDTTVAPATADVQQISVSFVPDLVAVRPH